MTPRPPRHLVAPLLALLQALPLAKNLLKPLAVAFRTPRLPLKPRQPVQAVCCRTRQALLVLAACSHLRWFPFHAEARRVRHGHRRQQQLRAPVASRVLMRQRTRWVTPGARPTRSANGANVTATLAHSLQRCLLVHGPHPTMQRLS